MRIADATGDGRLDVVVGGESRSGSRGAVWTFAGDGAGGFAVPQVRHLASSVADLAVADVTGDGRSDVVAALEDRLVVLAYTGPAVTTRLARADHLPSAVALADADRDGRIDAFVDTSSARGRVLLGMGAGASGQLAASRRRHAFAAPATSW